MIVNRKVRKIIRYFFKYYLLTNIKKYTIAIFKHNKSNNLILLLLTIPISNFRGEKRSNLFGDCVFPTKTNHHKNRTLELSLVTRAVYLDKFINDLQIE